MEDRLRSDENARKALSGRVSSASAAAEIAPPAPYLSRTQFDTPTVATLAAPPDVTPRIDSSIPESESINAWPDEAAESAFLAESRENGSTAPAAPVPEPAPTVVARPLPRLDELVERIPTEARELLEELFRAKFTTVRRVKPADLKPT